MRKVWIPISAVLLTPAALAGDQSSDLFSLSLRELSQVKITSATTTEETLKTVPATMTVYTREDLRRLGVMTLEQLVSLTPGYQSYESDSGETTSAARSRRFAYGAREVLILLDGQRLNDDLFGSATSYEGYLSLANVERIEFLRGPGSALYGAGAFLGVINIITSSQDNQLNVSGGNHYQNRLEAMLSGGTEEGPSWSLFANHLERDGESQQLYDSLENRFVDSQQRKEIDELYLRSQWQGWSLQLRHRTLSSDDGYSIGQIGNGYNHMEIERNLVALSYQHHFNNEWQFDSRLYDMPATYDYQWRTSAAPTYFASAFETRQTGFENRLTWQRNQSSAVMGIDYALNDLESAQGQAWQPPAPPAPEYDINETGTRKVTAAYGQWKAALTEDLSYVLGVRHDHYSDYTGSTSPRLGLIWQASPQDAFKLLYGESFRAPSRNEIGATNNPLQEGNPSLKPETAKTFEGIWVHSADRHYSSISLYNTQITDQVRYGPQPPPATKNTFTNADSAYTAGTEAEWRWDIDDHWQWRNQITYVFDPPRDINPNAERMASSSLSFLSGPFLLSLSGRYHGESRDANITAPGYTKLPSYTLWDLSAQYTPVNHLSVFARITNLTDKTYTQPAIQNSRNVYGVPSLGRGIEAGVRWNFD